ncbi:MAG: YdbL family protein [Proteobacteria bacterium]|nr:YdbL family protein [Pseudomonadota bacterium]
MKILEKFAAIVLLMALLVPTAYAVTLQEAKAAGLVGEQMNGYVGMVVANAEADVVALVQDVNNQRRERYREIAQQNGISLEAVAALAYERAVEATQAGHYIQDQSGRWVRK